MAQPSSLLVTPRGHCQPSKWSSQPSRSRLEGGSTALLTPSSWVGGVGSFGTATASREILYKSLLFSLLPLFYILDLAEGINNCGKALDHFLSSRVDKP